MKKVILAVLIILVIGVIIAGGVFIMIPKIGGMKLKNDELRSCSVSTGGGMLGGYSTLTLTRNENGEAILEVRSKETHADREVTTVYQVEEGAFDQLKEIAIRSDLYAASKRKYSPLQVLDGDTTTLWFSFAEASFSISDQQMMNKKMQQGFDDAERFLRSLAKGEGVTTLAQQEAWLYLRSGYTLCFLVEDAFDGKLETILSEEHEMAPFGDAGIVLADGTAVGQDLDLSGAEPAEAAYAGDIIYDSASGSIVILCEEYKNTEPIYILARLDHYADSAVPLIREMEGPYSLTFS